jgi:site-specific DNA-methyltransferase (adenine-specific)
MVGNRLRQGDCVEGLGRLEAGSVDLVFADPPFNIGYDYDVYDDRTDAEHYLDWTRAWGRAVHRALKPTGTFWLAIGDEYAAELKLIFQRDLGFTCRSWVIWYYTFGVNCTKKFSRSHAHLFHFVKDPKSFTFNSLAIRVPSARQLVYADTRADSRGRLPDDTWILRPQDLPEGFQPEEDTWYFSRVCGTFKERAGWHGCQMPEQLLGRIIRACSNPGELVVDPFAGSGTTLVVAKKLGRRWMGFELSLSYAAQAQARLDTTSEGQPLEGAEEPKVSAPATAAGKRLQALPNPMQALTERSEPSEIRRGIIEAFFAVRDGYSADRVIADPELNERFLETCRRLGIPGAARDWNHQLLNLRKGKRFTGLPRSHRSGLSREEIDRYSYACEIGLQHLQSQGQTLDEVLCDPAEAARFDEYVRPMIAEDVSSFKIRWVALYLRKRTHEFPEAARELDTVAPLPKRKQLVRALDWSAVPQERGLYWLHSSDKKLYVGKALDLHQRFELQLKADRFDFWGTELQNLEVRYCVLPDANDARLKGNQSRWIADWNPVGNFSEFAAQ